MGKTDWRPARRSLTCEPLAFSNSTPCLSSQRLNSFEFTASNTKHFCCFCQNAISSCPTSTVVCCAQDYGRRQVLFDGRLIAVLRGEPATDRTWLQGGNRVKATRVARYESDITMQVPERVERVDAVFRQVHCGDEVAAGKSKAPESAEPRGYGVGERHGPGICDSSR